MPDGREPIQVTVELYGMWRDIGGSRRTVVTPPSGSTLTDLVTLLGSRYGEDLQKLLINPATGELWSAFAIALNNSLIERASQMRQELHADDRVSFVEGRYPAACRVRSVW